MQGRELSVLAVLVAVYTLLATNVESGTQLLANILWKTASARPPILIVITVAGWGLVTALAKRARLRLELVIGPASPLSMETHLRCAVLLLNGILLCRLMPFAAQAIYSGRSSVAAWSLASDVAAHGLCLAFLVWPPSALWGGADVSAERAAAHGRYGHALTVETAHARDSLARTLIDALLAPLAPVTFWHVIVADYATSMAKALGDVHVTACVAFDSAVRGEFSSLPAEHSVWWEERRGPCVSSVLNASALALPFWCRLFQCFAVYSKTREVKNLWNAAKYATAFPLVYAGYLQRQANGGSRIFYIVAAICQSSATFAWDVLMDWGIFEKRENGALCGLFDPNAMRRSIVFSPQSTSAHTTYYALLILFDFALRFVWTLAVFGNAPTRGAGLFAFEVVEILRRTVWALFRAEWEYIHLGLPIADDGDDVQQNLLDAKASDEYEQKPRSSHALDAVSQDDGTSIESVAPV